jgi:hypothetical protein
MVEDKFIDQQHGYRTSRSCQTALTLFSQDIYNAIDGKNSRAGAVFVDLRKAFNSVDHYILLVKMLSNFGLSPHIIRLILSYLDDRVFRIALGSFISNYFSDPCGIPQGSPLGNLLFTIFVNDVTSALDLLSKLYADDLAFHTHGCDPSKIVETLSNTLSNLNEWCIKNKLVINDLKTEWMFFHKNHDTKFGLVPEVMLNDKIIKRVDKFRYLGVILDPTMTFKTHFNSVESRLNSAIYKLRSIKRYVPELVMKILFNAYVLPIYDYCIEIWCVQTKLELSTLQSKIYHFLLSYLYPTLGKKFKKAPKTHLLHSETMHSLLSRFNLLTVHERMNWTLLKNAHKYFTSDIPGLQSLFNFSTNTRSSRSMPLLQVERHSSESFKRSVHYRTVSLWNELPKDLQYETDFHGANKLCAFKQCI